MLIPKENRIRDKRYLTHRGDLPCRACGIDDETIVAAHVSVGRSSMSMKASDALTVPLCYRCHMDQEANPGPLWWLENVFKRQLIQEYEDWKHGR